MMPVVHSVLPSCRDVQSYRTHSVTRQRLDIALRSDKIRGVPPAAASPSPPGTLSVDPRSCCLSTPTHSDVLQP
jgi:hypothetical protein